MKSQRARIAVVSGLFLVALVTGAWLLDRGSRTGMFTAFEAKHLFEQVLAHVQNDYVQDVPDSALYVNAVEGMLYELQDPYSVFLEPERFALLNEMVSGDFAGLGVEVDIRDGSIVVVTPIAGGPAERAGILAGDRIVEIDGQRTDGWTNEEASHALRGKSGTSVSLRLERPGVSDEIPVSVTRREIHVSAVRRVAMVTPDVGYIDVKAFSDSTVPEINAAMETLIGRGMKSLVIDLRGNPGGLLTQGVRVSDLFLDSAQKIVSMKGRVAGANQTYSDTAAQKWPALLISVLVDGRTASAAEIVAGALQDHDRAVIVGRPTYGKGSAQLVFPLGAAGGLKLTTARWYTPSGRSIGKPALNEEDDNALQTATLLRHEKFRTDSGRVVYGAGGITPDVLAGDTALAPDDAAFAQALGANAGLFRDVVNAYALDLKGRHAISSPDFAVTPDMLQEVSRRLAEKGVKIDSVTFQHARPLVARLLGNEIARYVFGVDEEFRRRSRTDAALAKAIALSEGAPSSSVLLKRAASDKASADSALER